MPWSTHGDFRLTDQEMMSLGAHITRQDRWAARDRRICEHTLGWPVSSAHLLPITPSRSYTTFVLPDAGSTLRTDQLNEDLMQARRWLKVQPFRSP